MLKLASFTLLAILLSGCTHELSPVQLDSNPVRGIDLIETLCLNGVEYYLYTDTNRGGLAVVIDKDTLQPKLCSL